MKYFDDIYLYPVEKELSRFSGVRGIMLMKKWMNTIFFGSCFIVAVILEAYGMVVWNGNLFSVIALGVVVLITGYLFMDSIRSRLKQGSEDAKFYFDRILNEEFEKRNEKHTEIVNLQKAAYTATKKNTVLLNEQFTEVLTRLEAIEEKNSRMLRQIIELQKASLEGQKNALNMEISYSKDNTRKIIEAIKEHNPDQSLSNQQSVILSTYNGLSDNVASEQEEKAPDTGWPLEDGPEPEADNSIDRLEASEKKVIPLYDDPNKNLSADEIAKLFASFGN